MSRISPVYIADTHDHGHGLFCSDVQSYGSVVFTEIPLVSMQSLDNKQEVLTCTKCHKFIGTFRLHLNLLSKNVTRQEVTDPLTSKEYLDSLHQEGPDIIFSPIVLCKNGCGEAYCSSDCRDSHYASGHKYLCVGLISEDDAPSHPLIHFKTHAVHSNEIFLLAADVLAFMKSKFDEGMHGGMDSQMARQYSWLLFKDFQMNLWWDIIHIPNTASNDDDDVIRRRSKIDQLGQALHSLVDTSVTLLKSAIGDGMDDDDDDCGDTIFTSDRFSRIIGMFEQNNIGLRLVNPCQVLVRKLMTACRWIIENGGDIVEEDVEDVDDVMFFDICDSFPPKLSKICDRTRDLLSSSTAPSTVTGVDQGVEYFKVFARHYPNAFLSLLRKVVEFLSDEVNDDDDDHDHDDDDEQDDDDDGDYDDDDDGLLFSPIHLVSNPSDIILSMSEVYSDLCSYLTHACRHGNDIRPSRVFRPFDGTGLFLNSCAMNHSCNPSCRIGFSLGECSRLETNLPEYGYSGLHANVFAVGAMGARSEMTHSYVPLHLPTQERQKKLMDYGFICSCSRCLSEAVQNNDDDDADDDDDDDTGLVEVLDGANLMEMKVESLTVQDDRESSESDTDEEELAMIVVHEVKI